MLKDVDRLARSTKLSLIEEQYELESPLAQATDRLGGLGRMGRRLAIHRLQPHLHKTPWGMGGLEHRTTRNHIDMVRHFISHRSLFTSRGHQERLRTYSFR